MYFFNNVCTLCIFIVFDAHVFVICIIFIVLLEDFIYYFSYGSVCMKKKEEWL